MPPIRRVCRGALGAFNVETDDIRLRILGREVALMIWQKAMAQLTANPLSSEPNGC
jgi:hypothetical protein